MKSTITLNNGVAMPLIGYGVYKIAPEACSRCVQDAIAVGYRAIDTAQIYRNEEGVGEGWRASGIHREDLFLTTKIWVSNSGYERAKRSIDESLRKLQTDYVDLLLIHRAYGDYYGTYRAMEEALKAGKARALGVSNFYYDRFPDLADNVEIVPAVNQIETSVFCQQKANRAICKRYNTIVTAWAPMAEGKNGLFTHPVLTEIGSVHGKTAAQVALRFLTQQDIVVIPKSVHKARMAENFNSLDFDLSAEEMARIEELDLDHGMIDPYHDFDALVVAQQKEQRLIL